MFLASARPDRHLQDGPRMAHVKHTHGLVRARVPLTARALQPRAGLLAGLHLDDGRVRRFSDVFEASGDRQDPA